MSFSISVKEGLLSVFAESTFWPVILLVLLKWGVSESVVPVTLVNPSLFSVKTLTKKKPIPAKP